MSVFESTQRGMRIPSIIRNGQQTVTTAGTAEALASTKTEIVAVIIKALVGNTNNIYVGDSDVASSNGFVLGPGDPVVLAIDDLSKVLIDADTDGEGVSWLAFS